MNDYYHFFFLFPLDFELELDEELLLDEEDGEDEEDEDPIYFCDAFCKCNIFSERSSSIDLFFFLIF
jgi:hypothetical protein